jgi:hypothetical protein
MALLNGPEAEDHTLRATFEAWTIGWRSGYIEDAQAAMSHALRVDPKIRLSGMPIFLRRPEDRANYCKGARWAGMPE